MTYKKASKLKEEIFILSHLLLVSRYAIQSNNQHEVEQLSKQIEDYIIEEVKTYSNKGYNQWQCIIAKLNNKIKIGELIGEGKSSHKFILVLHAFMQELLDNDYQLPLQIIEFFEPFLEIENVQKISDEDWLSIKNSAEKRAKQLLKRLQKEHLFIL